MSASSSSSLPTPPRAPVVTGDPRFLAGRTLVERGLANEGAVEIFATLLEEARTKYGEASVEAAPAFYEYGNALLRAASASAASGGLGGEEEQQQEEAAEDGQQRAGKVGKADEVRSAAAAAAERRLTNKVETTTKDPSGGTIDDQEDKDDDRKPGAVISGESKESPPTDETGEEEEEEQEDAENDVNDDEEDLLLALEMMENAFAILEDYHDQPEEDGGGGKKYEGWTKEQLPRVLLGLGDTLSALGRHADSADAYSRALELRQAHLQELERAGDVTVSHLRAHRMVCEATVLVAEELLACPAGADVVTAETRTLVVNAGERVPYARGYYDKARDALQEAVVLMGTLAARNVDLGREKEDICFIATMVMGVGEALAAIEEEEAEAAAAAAAAVRSSSGPAKKKAKR
jgi:tetratricopeptide (TPR) repeat protein